MSRRLCVLVTFLLVLAAAAPFRDWLVQSANVVNFIATDDVGPWFKCVGDGCVPAGTESLAVVQPNTPIKISVGSETNTVHSFTSLVFPQGAEHMPFDQREAFRGSSRTVNLKDPRITVVKHDKKPGYWASGPWAASIEDGPVISWHKTKKSGVEEIARRLAIRDWHAQPVAD